MKAKRLLKRAVACVIALALSFGFFRLPYKNVMETSASKISDAKEKVEEYQAQQDEYDKQIKDTEDDIAKEEENQKAIKKQMNTVQKTIQSLDEYISELQANIDNLNSQIAETQELVDAKKTEIESGINDFKKRLRAMYIAGNDSYTSIILGADDFYDILMKVELVKRVANHDNKIIDNLVAVKNEYEAAKQKLEGQKAQVETEKATYDKQKAEKKQQRAKLKDLYSKSAEAQENLEKEKAIFEKKKSEIAKEQEQAEATWAKLVEEARQRAAAEEAARRAAGQNDTPSGNTARTRGGSSTVTGDFMWPVPGYYNITYGVGWRWGAYHAGIDISSSGIRGAQIVASDAGTVVQAENSCPHDYGKNGSCGCGGGYGRYCIVDHGNGYMTLYGHMENCIVSVGDKVNQGQTLGYVGSTGFSTGAHCHFEVRLNGAAQDPENYV